MNNNAVRIVAIAPVPGDSSKVRVVLSSNDPVVISLKSWANLNLKVGAELNPGALALLVEAGEEDKAFDLAIRSLRTKPRTQHEISAYLKRKGISEARIPDVLERLASRGLVDDVAYIRAFATQKQSTLSRREIALQLKRRGIRLSEMQRPEDAAAAREAERLAAEIAAEKYWRTHTKGDLQTRKMRLGAHLQRRGFPSDVILRAMAFAMEKGGFTDSETSFEVDDF